MQYEVSSVDLWDNSGNYVYYYFTYSTTTCTSNCDYYYVPGDSNTAHSLTVPAITVAGKALDAGAAEFVPGS